MAHQIENHPDYAKVGNDLINFLRNYPDTARWVVMQSLLPSPSFIVGHHLERLLRNGFLAFEGSKAKSHFSTYSLSKQYDVEKVSVSVGGNTF